MSADGCPKARIPPPGQHGGRLPSGRKRAGSLAARRYRAPLRRRSRDGPGPLTEEGIARHVAPLFSRVLHPRSAGLSRQSFAGPACSTRPRTTSPKPSGCGSRSWATRGTRGSAEIDAYRARLARCCDAPRADCVVPKTSAGQGLRAILNSYDRRRVSSRRAANSTRST